MVSTTFILSIDANVVSNIVGRSGVLCAMQNCVFCTMCVPCSVLVVVHLTVKARPHVDACCDAVDGSNCFNCQSYTMCRAMSLCIVGFHLQLWKLTQIL
jgi:hypothetical protein